MNIKRVIAALGCAGLVATGVAACGGGSDKAAGGSDGKAAKVTVKVGALPIIPVASMVLGKEQGFFDREGINLEVATGAQGGAANIASVMSGSLQFGFSDVVSVMLAAEKGLPIRAVAPAGAPGTSPKDATVAVMVPKGSPIHDPSQLAGKTIAVNALNNVTDVTIKGALIKRGVDISGIKFLEVPLPQAPAALSQKRVDAAYVVEPFISQAKSQGSKILFYNALETVPTGAYSVYFTSAKYISEHGDVVDRFVKAMRESNDYAQAHPDAVRATLPKFTQIPAPVAQRINLGNFDSALGPEGFDSLGAIMVKLHLLKEEPNLDELIFRGAQ